MSKVREWEYDDVMHDYLQWQDELERLLAQEVPDEEQIREVKGYIADFEDALFGDRDEDEYEDNENESEEN